MRKERWNNLYRRLCAAFGPTLADKIIDRIISAIGGQRISIPTIQYLQRDKRNRRIYDCFRGDYQAISQRFNISETTARRIIQKQRTIRRAKR